MIIVKCESCNSYHSDDDIVYVKPDVGSFCPDCNSDELNFMTDSEVLEELNG